MLVYTGWSDQGLLSEKETFEKMTEGSEGMSLVSLREGRKSFPGSRKENAKALRGEYA